MGTGEPRPYGRPLSPDEALFIKVTLISDVAAYFLINLPQTFKSYLNSLKQKMVNINFNEKKVIIADVDETICETTQLVTLEMAEMIDSLIIQGFVFVFISGTKEKYLTEMLSNQLKQKHYLLPCTGMQCIEVLSRTSNEEELIKNMVYKNQLSFEERKEIMDALEILVGHFNIVSLTTKEDQIQDRESQITLSPIGRSAPIELKKVLDPEGEKRKMWVTFLKTLLDFEKYDVNIAGTTSIDITRKGQDKAWGIKEFCKQYNFNLSEVFFIGDKTQPGGNDYPATKIVDFVTVKNPQDTLRKLKEIFT